jgi:hypothetical protein
VYVSLVSASLEGSKFFRSDGPVSAASDTRYASKACAVAPSPDINHALILLDSFSLFVEYAIGRGIEAATCATCFFLGVRNLDEERCVVSGEFVGISCLRAFVSEAWKREKGRWSLRCGGAVVVSAHCSISDA